MTTLYLIPTSLGPSELVSILPAEVCAVTASLHHFVAENAKTARAFLKQVSASHPLSIALQEIQITELNINTPAAALPALLAPLREGFNVGVLSEAGVPAVADPGASLVRLAHAEGIIKLLEQRSQQENQTQIFIETPYRNQALLEAMLSNCNGQTLVCVATDLTLTSESITTQTADAWKRDIAKGRLPDFHKKPTVFLFLAE